MIPESARKANVIQIPLGEAEFDDSSFVDPNGRLFRWKGQLYRGISSMRARLYEQLFRRGIIDRLVAKGLLVETELTPFVIDGYELVLRHRSVPFVSYPYEWCSVMFRDAALLELDLAIELEQHGLTLQDAHPWNILFDGPRPIQVDFSSIVPAGWITMSPALDEFRSFFLKPLALMNQGHAPAARRLLHEFSQGALPDLAPLTRGISTVRDPVGEFVRSFLRAKRWMPRVFQTALEMGILVVRSSVPRLVAKSRLDALRSLRKEVEEMLRLTPHAGKPLDSPGACDSSMSEHENTLRYRQVQAILSDLRPRSVLIVGSRGGYSQLAASVGAAVAALDVDEAKTTQLYCDSRERNLRILPLVMDVDTPSLASAVGALFSSPHAERYKAELVFAPAAVHDLAFEGRMDFDGIVKGLSILTKQWLLVEFFPAEARRPQYLPADNSSWYTLENFVSAARRQFTRVSIFPSSPEPKVFLLCAK